MGYSTQTPSPVLWNNRRHMIHFFFSFIDSDECVLRKRVKHKHKEFLIIWVEIQYFMHL